MCFLCQQMSLLYLRVSPPLKEPSGQFYDFDPAPFWGEDEGLGSGVGVLGEVSGENILLIFLQII